MKQYIERIRIKYNIRREYFTVLLPVLIAVLLVFTSILLGYGMVEQKSTAENDRLEKYEEIVREIVGEKGVEELPKEEKKTGLDHIIVFATLIAIIPYSMDTSLQKRRRKKKEELFTEFLFKLSELMRGGLDPVKAVIELSKSDLGGLTPHVRLAATAMTLGKSFEEAMKAMADSLESELISRYTHLVIQASYTGGAVSDLILKASEDMRSIIGIEREKEGNLKPYTIIFYFAQAIIVLLTYILSTSLLPYLKGIGAEMLFGRAEIADINFEQGFFHLIMINAFLGGIIIGKITEGSSKHGFKHAAILMVACYLACIFFVLPTPLIAEEVTIEIISGDGQEGFVGLPLEGPIVFKIYDLEGNPKSGVYVEFSITPGGMVKPSFLKTDKGGLASVKVTLGEEAGIYVIEAKVGCITKKATAIAKSEVG